MKKQPILVLASVLCITALAAGTAFAAGRNADKPEPSGNVVNAAAVASDITGSTEPQPSENSYRQELRFGPFHFGLDQAWDEETKQVQLEKYKEILDKAVEDGKINREDADEILKALEEGDFQTLMEKAKTLLPELGIGGRFSISDDFSIEGSGGIVIDRFGDFPAEGLLRPGSSMFFGDYFEENKDKTLGELKDEWLAELKTTLDEAVTNGTMTQEEADEAYQKAVDGNGFITGFGKGHGFGFSFGFGEKGFDAAPKTNSETTPEFTPQSTANKL